MGIWKWEKLFGVLARLDAYGESSIQRPQPDYDELIPIIVHCVWIGSGKLDYTFYSGVLDLIDVAKLHHRVDSYWTFPG